jgi:hypothetical protein
MEMAWEQRHQQAVAQGLDFYQDPETGNWVASELALKKQGQCCQSGCRHCPYEDGPRNRLKSAQKEHL